MLQRPDWTLVAPLLPALLEHHLQLQPSLATRAREVLQARLGEAWQPHTVLVGVHVRRGDFGGYNQQSV